MLDHFIVSAQDRSDSRGPQRQEVVARYGIRFAELDGGRRFARPVVVRSDSQTPATTLRDVPVFPQRGSGAEGILGRGDRFNPRSEDAFYVNVWSPQDADALPVVVFVHGGGWTSGGGAIPWYDGRHLAASGLVVVTMNYRLGAAGLLAQGSPRDDQTSLPVQDVLAALRWVSDNVARFGGDPGRVTLAGQSAGGWLVHLVSIMPQAADHFDRAAIWSMGTRVPRSLALQSSLVAAASRLSAPAALAELSPEQLLTVGDRALGEVLPPPPFAHAAVGWVPHAGGAVPLRMLDPAFAVERCTASGVMFRNTAHETGTFFHGIPALRNATEDEVWRWIETLPSASLPYDFLTTDGFVDMSPYERLVAVSSWLQYQGPARALADAYERRGRSVLTTTFSHWGAVDGQMSGHCLDLPFQFGTREEWDDAPMLRGCDDDEFDAISWQLISQLVDFASGRRAPSLEKVGAAL